MRTTQKYLCVKYMATAKKLGEWYCSHELVGKFVGNETLGITPMERLYEIINNDGGKFLSSNFIYTIEHRAPRKEGNPTRFAQFRIARKEKRQVMGLRDFSFAQ